MGEFKSDLLKQLHEMEGATKQNAEGKPVPVWTTDEIKGITNDAVLLFRLMMARAHNAMLIHNEDKKEIANRQVSVELKFTLSDENFHPRKEGTETLSKPGPLTDNKLLLHSCPYDLGPKRANALKGIETKSILDDFVQLRGPRG